jgi:hypothetical protein
MSEFANMVEFLVGVSDFYRARQAIAMANDSKTWRGMFKDVIEEALEDLTHYAASITHRETGNLAESHMWSYDSHRMKGQIFINPRSVWLQGNSTIRWPKIYGPYEHARGGSHAFYERTMKERGHILVDGVYAKVRSLPWP